MSAEQLQSLLELQTIDTHLDQLRYRRLHLPELAAVADINAREAAATAESSRIVSLRDEVAGRQAKLESELASTEERAAAVSRRLYGGEVSASRELQAMSADLEALKRRASELEDGILEILEEIEPLDHELERLGKLQAGVATEREGALSDLQAAETGVDDEIAGLAGPRQATVAGVPEPMLANYERLRSRLGGVAVARLIGNHCDGCHLTLPATELDRIRHLPAGELITCEQCGRILVASPSPSPSPSPTPSSSA